MEEPSSSHPTSVTPPPVPDSKPGLSPWMVGPIAVVLVLIVASALWLWLKPQGSPSAARRTLKVGLLAPLTGDNLSIGNGIRRAIQLARKDLSLQNADIQVVEKDSNCEAATAKKAMAELVSQGVVAVIGDYCSSSTLAALPQATKNHIVLISPAATSPNLSGASPYFFRTVPTDIQQGEFAAKLIYNKGYHKVAIIHDDDAYGIGLSKSFADNVTKRGGTVVANEVFPAESVQVAAQLGRIKAARPDALYIISVSATSDKAILESVRNLGVTGALYGSEALKDQTFIDDAGDAAEGLSITALPDGSSAYIDNYQAEFDDRPAIYSAQTYDAYMSLAKAIAAGATTGDAIKEHLGTLDFTGVSSHIKFNAQGDISTGAYEVVVVKGSKFVLSGE